MASTDLLAMKRTGIYIIRNTRNGKVYVGSAVDIGHRWNQHLHSFREQKHGNVHLQRAWDKYGPDAFEWKILIRCDVDDLLHYEQRAIEIYKAAIGWDLMYNISPTAASCLGVKHTRETRTKISKSLKGSARHKGKKHSKEAKAKMRAAKLGKKRGKRDPKIVAKIAAANKGQKRTPESKAKMSVAKKGGKLSPEHIAKIAAANRGKKRTPEQRARISAALKYENRMRRKQ